MPPIYRTSASADRSSASADRTNGSAGRTNGSAAEDNEWIFIQTSLYENQEKRLTSQPAYSLYKNIMIPLFIFLLQRYYVFAHYTIPIFRYFGGFLS